MKDKKTCLILGKKKETLKLQIAILKKGWKVINKNQILKLNNLINVDLVIAYNYGHILKKNILKKLKRPAINLHISYLPFNRGAHPNFWSFIENTTKGVTIHEINSGVDTGPIIYQKKMKFDINKKNITFFNTHKVLNFEIKKLFFKRINEILDKKYVSKKQKKGGTLHYKRDLPKDIFNNWKIKIKDFLKEFH